MAKQKNAALRDASLESPHAAPDAPALARNVLVTTAGLINGQSEHAGIITQVLGDGSVNVMVLPGSGQPYPITSIRHADDDSAGPLHWRYPPQG
jgi:hypothetical protein